MQEKYFQTNQQHWDELVGVHTKAESYELAAFKAGKLKLHSIEREELGDVSNQSLLHLQCHFGLDTLSWARLGAHVTGIDFSSKAIQQAQAISQELAIPASFLCSSVYDLPQTLSGAGTFDIVFTSYGAISWLPDLQPWARVIAHFLKPGGTFYIAEGHPFMWAFDGEKSNLQLGYPYASKPDEPIMDESQGSYADHSAHLSHPRNYGWNHSLGQILNSLIEAGLTINFLHEFYVCPWECFPNMEEIEGGFWRIKDPIKARMLPLIFSLKATR